MLHQLKKSVREQRFGIAILSAMSLLYFFSFFHRVSVPGTIFNQLQTDLGLSAAAVTAIGSVFLYVYGGSQFIVGFVVDRMGGVTTIIWGGLLMTLGALLFPFAQAEWFLYLTRAFLAFGCSAMYLCLVKEVDLLFGSKNFTPIIGAVSFASYTGGLVATLPFERTVAAIGWRPALFLAGLASAAALIALVVLKAKGGKSAEKSGCQAGQGSYLGIIRNPLNIPVVFSGSVLFATYFVVQATLGKKFLEDVAGLGSGEAASFMFVMMLTMMVAVFGAGVVARLLGDRRKVIIVACALLSLASMLLLLFGVSGSSPSDRMVFLAAYALLALSSGVGPIIASSMKELNHPEAVAQAVGFANGMVYLLVAVFANGVGIILDLYKSSATVTAAAILYPSAAYRVVFVCLLCIVFLALISSFFIKETKGENLYDYDVP